MTAKKRNQKAETAVLNAKTVTPTRAWPADAIERRKVSELIPYARNARTHSDAQVAQIAASIKEWGWTNPVLIDPDGGIIAGHGRVLAARKRRKLAPVSIERPAVPECCKVNGAGQNFGVPGGAVFHVVAPYADNIAKPFDSSSAEDEHAPA